MISKKTNTPIKEKKMARQTSLVRLISVITTLGLLVSQSVYAADEASSGGIPGWVWMLLIVAILVGITLLPKKWINPTQAKPVEKKSPTPAPVAKKVEPQVAPKPAAPKVEAAPVVEAPVEPTPVIEPVVVEAVQESTKVEPVPEAPIQVIDALDEAKQLLAQQRFPQAVGILNKGLQKEPERSDLMLELLAIYSKQKNHEEFDALFEQLKQLDDPLALIQGEELHNQLERPIIAEDSDLIEYDATKVQAPVTEPESEPTPAQDYSADSLAFTSTSLTETVESTPVETDFSLDDIDLSEPAPVEAIETKEVPVEVSAKQSSGDIDFSDFDDFIISAPSGKVVQEEAPIVDLAAKEVELTTPAIKVEELKTPTVETSQTDDLVDLEFDLDDSFSFDEDKAETSAKKAEWAADLSDENFASPTETTPAVVPTVGELITGETLTSLEEEFPFLQSTDTFQIRLDLARNYIALGEISSAKELLNEVAEQGTGTIQAEAKDLIAKLAS